MNTQPAKPVRKTERLDLRVDPETKRLLQRAAEISDTRLTEFLIQTGVKHAEKLVSQPAVTRVSAEEFCRVLDLIENPPEPTPELVEALSEH